MGEIRFVGTGENRGYPYLVCKKIHVIMLSVSIRSSTRLMSGANFQPTVAWNVPATSGVLNFSTCDSITPKWKEPIDNPNPRPYSQLRYLKVVVNRKLLIFHSIFSVLKVFT